MSKPRRIAVHDHIIVGKREWGVLSFNIVGQSGNGFERATKAHRGWRQSST
jgi:hypothetical protein